MSANVNKPTDVKKRDEDIARKLQLYGIANAFRAGKVPSVGHAQQARQLHWHGH